MSIMKIHFGNAEGNMVKGVFYDAETHTLKVALRKVAKTLLCTIVT